MTRHQLDLRGMRCPWPALRLARLMRSAMAGDEVEMLLDDPQAENEIAALARENSWTLARTDEASAARRFTVRR